MIRAALLALAAMFALSAFASPAAGQGQCSFCGDNPAPPDNGGRPDGNNGGGGGNGGGNGQGQMDLTIESDIDFGRLILVGNGIGSVVLDVDTGQKMTFGEIDDLGGVSVQGRALVTGMPLKQVRVTMPLSVTMSDPGGGEAELRDIVTDLSALPTLDANGQLTFHFSGTLYTDNAIGMGGTLRGRVPIQVTYTGG